MQVPIRAITIRGTNIELDETIWLFDQPADPEIGSAIDLSYLSKWANLMRVFEIYTLAEDRLICVHDHNVIGGSNVEVIISVGSLRAYLNNV
jgi:hypothetical protein